VIAYGIATRKILEVGLLLRRVMSYVLLTIYLLALYAGVWWLFTTLLRELAVANAQTIGHITAAVVVGYNWTQTHYYVGNDHGYVAIYRGVQQNLGPIALSTVYEKTDIPLSQLPSFNRGQVEATISAANLSLAKDIVDRLANAGN